MCSGLPQGIVVMRKWEDLGPNYMSRAGLSLLGSQHVC